MDYSIILFVMKESNHDKRVSMNPSLQNITAMMLVITLFIVSFVQIQTYGQTRQNQEAKEMIIKSLASECKALKVQYKLEDSFENTSKVLTQMLGSGLHNLDEETYLAVMSFCYGGSKLPTVKEKI